MILVTHEIIGGALAVATHANPTEAFFLGLASHYIFDMIPHWHYKVSLEIPFKEWDEKGKAFIKRTKSSLPVTTVIKGLLDGTSGVFIMLLFLRFYDYTNAALIPMLAGMFGSILPDLLTGLSKVWPSRLAVLHTKIHLQYIHTKILLDDRPLIGIGSQILISVCALALAFVFR